MMCRLVLIITACLLASPALAIDMNDTRLLEMPAISQDHIAFVYDNDLWLVGRDGGKAERITHAQGYESHPAFSPDGHWLAFSANYHGNTDIYVMPSSGGETRRLTWHPGDDIVRGFTPDGRSVLFESSRDNYTNRLTHLYTIPILGGAPSPLPVPSGAKAALSPDGKFLAYSPLPESNGPWLSWKNNRGGHTSRIWILSLADLSVMEVPKPAAGSNDTDPMWAGNVLYFNSDRGGEFNLFRYDRSDGAITQLTHWESFPVLNPSMSSDGVLVFEQAGYLYRLDSASSKIQRLKISVTADLTEIQPRWVSGTQWVRSVSPAPDLKRAVVEFRGKIATVPAEKGDPRIIAADPAGNDRDPIWSPDGSQIAWFSDRDGEYALYINAQDGRGKPKRYALEGSGFYYQPTWSPDGLRIAYCDNSQSLRVLNLINGKTTKVAQQPVLWLAGTTLSPAWSPDSQWLTYARREQGLLNTVYIWSVAQEKSFPITDGLADVTNPVFDPNGELLYVLASTDAGPLQDWFAQTSWDMELNYGVYAITLRQDGPNPIRPASDETTLTQPKTEQTQKPRELLTPKVRIDLEGISDRIVALPIPMGTLRNLRVGESGELYFLQTIGRTAFHVWDGAADLKRFTLNKQEPQTLAKDVDSFSLSINGKNILYQSKKNWFISPVTDQLAPGKGKLALDAIKVPIEPRAEWAQILNEAWRFNRDYFYAPNYHGTDWKAIRKKYQEFLPHITTRHTLDHIISGMISELSASHILVTPGDYSETPDKITVGLLGADFTVEQNHWRFKKIYGGLNWNPELHAPLRAPGVNVKEGEYLLAIEGHDLQPTQEIYAALENTVGKPIKITVSPNANGKNSREVIITPIADEENLRYFSWIESNIRYVNEKTSGRIAYVHVPNTTELGHSLFKRYFYPQSHKDAIIIDERYNKGGLFADYIIDILRRPPIAQWAERYGNDLVSPRAAIFGPKVMIANENSASGGDLLPWLFKKLDLGPLIGKRTWGGLIGMQYSPALIDGGSITLPTFAIWNEQGWVVENQGISPDIEVEQWPKDTEAGHDPQLDKAIEVALTELEKHPQEKLKRPAYPIRARSLQP